MNLKPSHRSRQECFVHTSCCRPKATCLRIVFGIGLLFAGGSLLLKKMLVTSDTWRPGFRTRVAGPEVAPRRLVLTSSVSGDSACIDAATTLEIRVQVIFEVKITANNYGVFQRLLFRMLHVTCVGYADAYVPKSGDIPEVISDLHSPIVAASWPECASAAATVLGQPSEPQSLHELRKCLRSNCVCGDPLVVLNTSSYHHKAALPPCTQRCSADQAHRVRNRAAASGVYPSFSFWQPSAHDPRTYDRSCLV